MNILSLEAKDIFGANNPDGRPFGEYSIRSADGKLSLRKFTNTLDWSLDTMKLQDVYERRARRKDFSFKGGRHVYTKHVICVNFQYSYKEFNQSGRNTFIRAGYNYRDCVFEDGACVVDGKLIGIQTNVEVQTPLTQDVLGSYFTFTGEYYEQIGTIPTIMDRAALREHLYHNGFWCDGIEYVRYKRSSGSSRVGKCLFVNKMLAADMDKWDKCGLDIKPGQPIDLACFEAYRALPTSSIIDTVDIPVESILVVNDYESKFEDDVVAVDIRDGHLFSEQKKVDITNSIFDGESLLDVSMFSKYPNKGMLLLRNRFFKSCCFNTNIQQWFADNGITEIAQLKGFTLATDISQIKMITTPSSVKYMKFGTVEQWLRNIDSVFGVVKFEKPPHPFDGRMVQVHYQLLNSLQLSYDEMKTLLQPSLDYIAAIRRYPAVLRYDIQYPDDEEKRDEINSLKSKNEIIFKMLAINDKFTKTKMYYDFRDDLVRGKIRGLKQGHVLVNGNYSTLFGNGMEMLKAAIGTFAGEPEIGAGCVHSSRFGYDVTLLGTRSPHITAGNVLLVKNIASAAYDKYFNLTPEIVCINSIGENILQRLDGCDFDSDTMLITDNELLINAAKKNYEHFKVPTSFVAAKKTSRYFTPEDQADLDVKTSVNKIGEIINLSQQLNSLMWERINKGHAISECMELYCDICKLAVLSGVEIDRAKKEFIINSATEIDILKQKYKLVDDGKVVKPNFFKMITTENGYKLSGNIKYRYFDTSMDYLQKIISQFNFREAREQKRDVIPFMDIIKKPLMIPHAKFHYMRRDCIIATIRAAKEDIRKLYIDYDTKGKDERSHIQLQAAERKQNCIDEIDRMSESPSVMYVVLKELDNKEHRDLARFVFEVLFGKPNEAFFTMVNESKEDIYTLIETEDGDITYYGFKFKKVKMFESS